MMEDKLYPYSPGSQDSDTSIEAAELIKEGAETIRKKVFDVIVNKGVFGATPDEIADLLALSAFTIRPRVTELYKQGKIERKEKRKNKSGRLAYAYVVSKQHINNQYSEKGI